jgi:hypothetical protein
VTQARIKSIHFPSIQYFALFNGKCIVGKKDCSALCGPDLSLIHTALNVITLEQSLHGGCNIMLVVVTSMVGFMLPV